jgi:hypothetical protein
MLKRIGIYILASPLILFTGLCVAGMGLACLVVYPFIWATEKALNAQP